jgi:hypothetical protein
MAIAKTTTVAAKDTAGSTLRSAQAAATGIFLMCGMSTAQCHQQRNQGLQNVQQRLLEAVTSHIVWARVVPAVPKPKLPQRTL